MTANELHDKIEFSLAFHEFDGELVSHVYIAFKQNGLGVSKTVRLPLGATNKQKREALTRAKSEIIYGLEVEPLGGTTDINKALREL